MKNCILTSIFMKPPFITFLGIGLVLPDCALAYLDLYTGSYFLQLLLGGLFGVLFAVKIYWTKIKEFFFRLFSVKNNDDRQS